MMRSLGLLAAVFALAAMASRGAKREPFAQALLEPTQGSGSQARGTIEFLRDQEDLVVRIRVSRVAPGDKAIHVHEHGDCGGEGAAAAGGHFNPTAHHHGGPTGTDRHVGDFGNVTVGKDGQGKKELRFASIAGFDWKDFVGRSVVLHENADDLKSQPSGNSGKRIACGVLRASGAKADAPASP
jgi:Cu-Zn family superoxide dismutase